MVQRDIARQRVGRALAHLADAELLFAQRREVFLADRQGRDAAIFYLFLAIQECIDLAAHWIADEDLAPADSYAASFGILADRRRIAPDLAPAMAAAAGLRNLIVHGYAELDPGRVRDEAATGIAAVRRFLEAVATAAGL